MINDRVIQSPFAWYRSKLYLEQNSEACSTNGCNPALIGPSDRLLPFQIRIPNTGAISITGFVIERACGGSDIDLGANIPDIQIDSDGAYHYVIYKGTAIAATLSDGLYNGKLVTSLGTFYSETFCAKSSSDLAKLFKLEWWSTCNFTEGSPAFYETGYKNLIYLDGVMLAPKLELEEDSEKDGYGNAIPIRQRFIWRYRLSTDQIMQASAMAICSIPMHSNNVLTLPDGRITNMEQVKPDPNFQECGAFMVLEFQESTIIKTACCGGEVISGGGTSGGEFSEEFSEEFD